MTAPRPSEYTPTSLAAVTRLLRAAKVPESRVFTTARGRRRESPGFVVLPGTSVGTMNAPAEIFWRSPREAYKAREAGLRRCLKALESSDYIAEPLFRQVVKGMVDYGGWMNSLCVYGKRKPKPFRPEAGDYVSFRGRPGRVDRCWMLSDKAIVQFGADGPFKPLSFRSLKPATREQIYQITGER